MYIVEDIPAIIAPLTPLNNTTQLALVVIDNISIFNFLLELKTSINKLLDDFIVSVLCLIEASDSS